MSDAQHPHDNESAHPGAHASSHEGAHEGPIKTPKQLILAVLYAFVVPVVVIYLLVEFVTSNARPAAGTQALAGPALAERIRPVGMVQIKDASDLSTLKTGEQVFAGQCTSCHTAGLVGAPKFGDAAAWAPRIATGYDALLHSALGGKGNMGAQGGGDYTDIEVGRAVVYMANKAGAKFDEPKLPAAAASASAAGSASTSATAAPDAGAAVAATTAAAMTPAMPAMPAAPAATAATVTATSATLVASAEPGKGDAGGAAPALYGQVCQACHAAGVVGSPKFGDKAAWAPRIAAANGIDGLTASAIKGKGVMPPRGGSQASDAEIKAVVAYMVNAVK